MQHPLAGHIVTKKDFKALAWQNERSDLRFQAVVSPLSAQIGAEFALIGVQ